MQRRVHRPRQGSEYSNSNSSPEITNSRIGTRGRESSKKSSRWQSALKLKSKRAIIMGLLTISPILALLSTLSTSMTGSQSSSQAQSLDEGDLGLVAGMNSSINADLKVDKSVPRVVHPMAVVDNDSNNNSRENVKMKASDDLDVGENSKIINARGHSNYDETKTDLDLDLHLDHGLYEQVYSSYQHAREGLQEGFQFTNYMEWKLEESKLELEQRRSLETYGEKILEGRGCDITVLFTDPRIPSETKRGSTASFALESVAKFLPQACVIIQTSKCKVEEAIVAETAQAGQASADETEKTNKSTTTSTTTSTSTSFDTKDAAEKVIYHMLYQMSLPLFRKMINEGRVRVAFLDHEKYHLKSCSDFFNPSAALMNINFWGDDEFIPDVDSDTVLFMQNDSVLCHGFDIDVYRKYAMVGGVWNPYACGVLLSHWKMYIQPLYSGYLRGKTMEFVLDWKFPEICSDGNEQGPLGNGGFSLRSRSAMRKAIETCPHKVWSGIDTSNRNLPCLVDMFNDDANAHAMQEDVYFGTVLRATNASLPTAFVASLFAVEMAWPDQAIEMYGGPSDTKERGRLAKEASCTYHNAKGVKWGKDEKAELKNETVPIGFHQPYVYQSKESLMSQDVKDQCPLLQYMYDPLFKRSS